MPAWSLLWQGRRRPSGPASSPTRGPSTLTADGLDVADALTGETWQVRADRVVNAAGAWSEHLDDRVDLVRSRGAHLVVAASSLGNPHAALMVPVEGSTTRFVFALPQPDGLVFIGLTDVEPDDPLDEPRASAEEVDFLLHTINRGLTVPLGRDDIIGAPTPATGRCWLAPRGRARTCPGGARYWLATPSASSAANSPPIGAWPT